ncbi:3-phosphoshikimate 1-carboxyvinyltransferase [Thalassobacillus hwangdonensis]|uniref:3-phosphoshikimate 1-carboxyvinyltransferase n=1 Tax=Thalassobacillus hwangdonensis TaxID=546108 RepID=A0ABW3KX75_9BACI
MTETKQLQPIEQPLKGEVYVPGDKSISHRAVIFASLARGRSKVEGFLTGEDCLRTVEAFRMMGVSIEQNGKELIIDSPGVDGFSEPSAPINFGNSGTTARLVAGVLASLPFFTTSFGDESLSRRPMDRVVMPLREMGAHIEGRDGARLLPLSFIGSRLRGITYQMPVKSAQVKSAILLAGVLGEGTTTIVEKAKTRDHTEQMLPRFGVDIFVRGNEISVTGGQTLSPADMKVPGDISSAAFFIAAAAIIPGSHVIIKDVGLNHTRTGFIDALRLMGAEINTEITRTVGGEPIGEVEVVHRKLHGTTIDGDIIPRLIDEIPILALVATQAGGETIIKDAAELRVKETDRVETTVNVLQKMGAYIIGKEDGMTIQGGASLKGASLDSMMDHRIGMMISIASMIAEGTSFLHNGSCIDISYPDFFADLENLVRSS